MVKKFSTSGGSFANLSNELLTIGNALIRRDYWISGTHLIPIAINDPACAGLWGGAQPAGIYDWMDEEEALVDFVTVGEDIERCLHVCLVRETKMRKIETHWLVADDLPFVKTWSFVRSLDDWKADISADEQTPKADGVESKSIKSSKEQSNKGNGSLSSNRRNFSDLIDAACIRERHIRLTSVSLGDKTDIHDELVQEHRQLLYGKEYLRRSGSIFLFDAYARGRSLLMAKESPSPSSQIGYPGHDLVVENGSNIRMTGSGLGAPCPKGERVRAYGSIVGVGAADEIRGLFKRFVARIARSDKRGRYMLSNTWGDRNQDKAVCQTFVAAELDRAAALGIDAVQIDDGWQKGITSNSALASGGVFSGYYAKDAGFWSVNAKKFPEGLEGLAKKARAMGVEIGLWFSPDSSDAFANWQKDVDTILALHARLGVRFVKLDGVEIPDKLAEQRYERLLAALHTAAGDEIIVCQDITAGDRVGLLYLPYGLIFVENRYTDWGNYYPHRTLRNLWNISAWLPTDRLQMELLNVCRNTQCYQGDPFAPDKYGIDWLFASVMVANPLLWMELSELKEEAGERLKGLIEVYKRMRPDLKAAVVLPIGDMPDGLTYSGFQVITSETSGYLLLFRELGAEDAKRYKLDRSTPASVTLTLLYTDSPEVRVAYECEHAHGLTLSGLKRPGYAIYRYQKA